MYHALKCWPQYFTPMEAGQKTFELRKDDRGFCVHDTLRIREWNPDTERYTGREVMKEITYILEGPLMGLDAGWVILGLSHGG